MVRLMVSVMVSVRVDVASVIVETKQIDCTPSDGHALTQSNAP